MKWLAAAIIPPLALFLGAGVAGSAPPAPDTPAASAAIAGDSYLIAVAPPPFTPGIFPCSRCHAERVTNRERRELKWAHEEIRLQHDEKNRWCLACHDADNRDQLHLVGGQPVPFTQSYRLCGQCHGPSLRNWLAGEHGKRTGSWSGAKQYLLCPSCHNPHSPRFQPLQPLPPPVKPADLGREEDTRARR